MKRFYKDVSVIMEGQGFTLWLDEKPVKTPRRNVLFVATSALAEAIAIEWRAQGENVQPHTMPLTQIANGICDLTNDEQARLVAHMAGYVDGDMLYFRDEENADVYPRQEAEWEPWLCWAEERYDMRFKRQMGISLQRQSHPVHLRLREVLTSLPLTHLIPLNILATGFSSLILALAVYERALPVAEAYELSLLEQRVQSSRWGEDAEQESKNAQLLNELMAAAVFLELLTVM